MNTNTQEINKECIDVCNSLLRGELSAVETYNQTIEKFRGEHECGEIIRIRDEHARCIGTLRMNIFGMGGDPCTESGAWGIFAKSVQGAANLFGDDSALAALQRGEEHGRNDYERALNDDNVLAECKQMIRNDLLPKVREHIATLEKLES